MWPLRGKAYCWAHSPEHIVEREAARQLGGKKRRRRRPANPESVSLTRMSDVRALLERVISDTLALENSPKRSRVLVSAALAAIKAVEGEANQMQIDEAKARFGL